MKKTLSRKQRFFNKINLTTDDAGNMTTDKDDYEYFYDYENRLVKIEGSSSVEVATMDYDALGRRIRVIDKSADPDVTTLYYYNPNWQVLAEYNGAGQKSHQVSLISANLETGFRQ